MATKKKESPAPADDMTIPEGSQAAGGLAMLDDLGIPKVGVSKKKTKRPQQLIKPEALTPNLVTEALAEQFKYWIGIHPDCPVEGIGAGGLTFSKVNELLIPDHENKIQRVPVIGGIANIDREMMTRLARVLPRIVIRFEQATDPYADEGGRAGLNVGDAYKKGQRGRLITIPRNNKDSKRRYIASKNDRPAINWMFMQLCADQDSGSRGTTYPESIAKTGLAWHGEPLDL